MQVDAIDFDQVTAGLTTKSDKMRALARRGVRTAEIARYMDVKYQFARNVLTAAGLHRAGEDKAAPGDAKTAALRKHAWATIDGEGRLQLPEDLLTQRGLKPGTSVYIGLTEDGLELLSQRAALARAQAIAAPYKRPGVSEVDDFIAERRREATREDAGE